MTASSRFGSLAALLLGSLMVCAAHTAAAAPKSGVVSGSGTNSGGVFTAGASGAVYRLPSQAELALAPGAAVRIFPAAQPLQLTPGAKTTTYSFALLAGRADVSVPSKPKSAVLCSIGKLSTVIGAGQATLLTRADGAIVAAAAGDVRTLSENRWQTLTPGTLAHFGPQHSGSPQPSIAPPELTAGQRLWFSPGEAVPLTGIAFRKVDGAASYELRLQPSDGGAPQLRALADERVELGQPLSAAPGEYQLSARAIDRDGIAGSWSSAQALRVVGVTLPPGGYASAGEIFVGRGQEVRFSHTDGLEMTYEGAGRFVPASEAVSLYRGETTVVSFRVPGSVFATSARLRPRGVFAHVDLGPSRAVWPNDSIEIAIELRSKEGAPLPEWLELKPEVKLGIEPVEVAFTRSGKRLVGRVPATDKPGPWVLRVEVKDQFGALLGRDFLEIAKAPPALPAKAAASTRVASQ